jgi:hypothetical protein
MNLMAVADPQRRGAAVVAQSAVCACQAGGVAGHRTCYRQLLRTGWCSWAGHVRLLCRLPWEVGCTSSTRASRDVHAAFGCACQDGAPTPPHFSRGCVLFQRTMGTDTMVIGCLTIEKWTGLHSRYIRHYVCKPLQITHASTHPHYHMRPYPTEGACHAPAIAMQAVGFKCMCGLAGLQVMWDLVCDSAALPVTH